MRKLSLITIVLVLVVDQLSKFWVKTNMYLGERRFENDLFEIYFIENNGMAFGTELGGVWGKLALSIFRIGAIIGIGYYLWTLIRDKRHRGLIFAIALIFAGAFGNIIDSAFYGMVFSQSFEYGLADFTDPARFMPEGGGYGPILQGKVVDMLHFTVHWPEWMPWLGGSEVFPPVFNVADSAITVGVFLIIFRQKTFFPNAGKDFRMPWSKKDNTNRNTNGNTNRNRSEEEERKA